MSRTNPHAKIVSEEQLVPSANRLKMTKNNQHVASDTNITDTMLRFVVEILRHHKLYKPISLIATVLVIYLQQFWTTITHNSNTHSFTFQLDTQTFTLNAELLRNVLQMPQSDSNKPYTKPPTENKILRFIKILGYDEDPKAKMTYISTFVATRLRQPSESYSEHFASLIWDEFKWQAVDRTTKPTKMSKLMYTRFTKLIIDHFLSCNKSIPRRSNSNMHSEGQDLPLTKLTNTVKGYKYYRAKKAESEKAKAAKEPEEQHVSPMKSGRGEDYMRLGDQEVNVPSAFKKNDVLRKKRSLNVAENIVKETPIYKDVKDTYAEWERKRKGPVVEDPDAHLLLDLRKGSKTRRLKSLKQAKQVVAGEGLKRDDETDDSDSSKMDLSEDEPRVDDDATGIGVFNDAHTTSVVANLDGNPEEMFPDEVAHHISPPPANTTYLPIKDPQPSSLQAKAKKLMQKEKNNMRNINFKRDPPTDREEEKKKKRRKDDGQSSSKASRKDKAPMKSGSAGAAKRRTTWLDLLLKSDIHQNENHVLGPSTVAIAKKLKELIQKDELTIANLEGNEDIISERWSKEVHRYQIEALNGIHHWEDGRQDFFKVEINNRTPDKVYSDKRIISVVRVVMKRK
ncbi:hypothetical protein Tco_1203250 [Tanacetum coccineum]